MDLARAGSESYLCCAGVSAGGAFCGTSTVGTMDGLADLRRCDPCAVRGIAGAWQRQHLRDDWSLPHAAELRLDRSDHSENRNRAQKQSNAEAARARIEGSLSTR